jgi:PhzF family phenazine biosynthesis protein
MQQPVYQVDAFTDVAFGGNPAAVCPVEAFPGDSLMQNIAMEMNLAETAFVVPVDAGAGHYRLRWFTPTVEVNFCGHATLATAFILFTRLNPDADRLRFDTRVGALYVSRLPDGRLQLDLPNLKPVPTSAPEGLAQALGAAPLEVFDANTGDSDLLLIYADSETVASMTPDMAAMQALAPYGFIVTAPGQGVVDFVSRCFFPNIGIPEDPVTGSAHCASGPYWAARLGKKALRARQISARGGDLWLDVAEDRVLVAGHAVETLSGTLQLPDAL